MSASPLRPVIRAIPIVLVVVVAVVGFVTWQDESSTPDVGVPVVVDAVGPIFDTADEMADASDLVVDATVIGVEPGRIITDADDVDQGIRTRLVELDVESTLVGDAPDVVIVEQEASLLDGTAIVVDGVEPFETGERAIWFLVEDPTGGTDLYAVVNSQGRVPVP